MFFIDDDQTKTRQWREDRQTRAKHDVGLPLQGLQPGVAAFSFRQVAVQAN